MSRERSGRLNKLVINQEVSSCHDNSPGQFASSELSGQSMQPSHTLCSGTQKTFIS